MPRKFTSGKSLEARLINRCAINENGCWVWQGAVHRSGYGVIRVGSAQNNTRRVSYVHCEAYKLWVGPLGEDQEVTHSCAQENILCVNPNHLIAATHVNVPRHRKNSRPRGDGESTDVGEHIGVGEWVGASVDG